MTEFNVEKLISDYLDSVYVISHSQASVDSYRSGIDHFSKFVQSKYEKSLEQILSLMKDESRTIQNNFKVTSEKMGIPLTPHVLRSVFTEKCTVAKIPDKYIDALCGRTSPSIIAKHYTDYSPVKLRLQYNLVEPLLVL